MVSDENGGGGEELRAKTGMSVSMHGDGGLGGTTSRRSSTDGLSSPTKIQHIGAGGSFTNDRPRRRKRGIMVSSEGDDPLRPRRASVTPGRRVSVFDSGGIDATYEDRSPTLRSPEPGGGGGGGDGNESTSTGRRRRSRRVLSVTMAPQVESLERLKATHQFKRASRASIHRAASISHRASMGMTVSFSQMLYGHGKVAAQYMELSRGRERVQALRHECEMQRMYREGAARVFERSVKHAPVRRQVEVLVRNDILQKSSFEYKHGKQRRDDGNGSKDQAAAATTAKPFSWSSSSAFGGEVDEYGRRRSSILGGSGLRRSSLMGLVGSDGNRRGSISDSGDARRSSIRRNSLELRTGTRRRSSYRLAEKHGEHVRASVLMSTIKRGQDLQLEAEGSGSRRRTSTVVGAEAAGNPAFAAAREQLQALTLCPTDDARLDFRRNITLVHLERYFYDADKAVPNDMSESSTFGPGGGLDGGADGMEMDALRRRRVWSRGGSDGLRRLSSSAGAAEGERRRRDAFFDDDDGIENDDGRVVVEVVRSVLGQDGDAAALRHKLRIFLPHLRSIFAHYARRRNVYYGHDDIGLDDGDALDGMSGDDDDDDTGMRLYQFWQFVKESRLVCREMMLPDIDRMLCSVLQDSDDESLVHAPMRGPIGFVHFVSAMLRIVRVRVRGHGSLSQRFVRCMERMILRTSCGQKRAPFYSRYYDAVTQRLLRREDGFIQHIYCYFRDYSSAGGSGESGAAAAAAASAAAAAAAATSGNAIPPPPAPPPLPSPSDAAASGEAGQRVNMTIRDVRRFVDDFELYQGFLTIDRLSKVIKEVMALDDDDDDGLVIDEKKKKKKTTGIPKLDKSAVGDAQSPSVTTTTTTTTTRPPFELEGGEELLFEEFIELICRIAVAHLPRFKALLTPLPAMVDRVIETLKRLSSVKYVYHMDSFSSPDESKMKKTKMEEVIQQRMQAAQERKYRIEMKFGRVRDSIIRMSRGNNVSDGDGKSPSDVGASDASLGGDDTTAAAMASVDENASRAQPKRERRTNNIFRLQTAVSSLASMPMPMPMPP